MKQLVKNLRVPNNNNYNNRTLYLYYKYTRTSCNKHSSRTELYKLAKKQITSFKFNIQNILSKECNVSSA